jgi:ribosome-associated protein
MTASTTPSIELAIAAARAADDKGATDIVVLDVGDLLGICGYFVIATASNPRQVRAVVDEVEEQLGDRFGDKPRSVEGATERRWVLLDYADVVVHVFHAEERDYYRLERLYSDATRIEWRPGAVEGDNTVAPE